MHVTLESTIGSSDAAVPSTHLELIEVAVQTVQVSSFDIEVQYEAGREDEQLVEEGHLAVIKGQNGEKQLNDTLCMDEGKAQVLGQFLSTWARGKAKR